MVKPRFIIRFHPAMRECLETEAAINGSSLSALASQILHEQAQRFRADPEQYELSPHYDDYLLVQGATYRAAARQLSICLVEEDYDTVLELQERLGFVHRNGTPDLRPVLVGMLLNSRVFSELVGAGEG